MDRLVEWPTGSDTYWPPKHVPTPYEENSIWNAAKTGEWSNLTPNTIQKIARLHVMLHLRDINGDTPFHQILRSGHQNKIPPYVLYCLSSPATLGDKNNDGETVLHLMVQCGYLRDLLNAARQGDKIGGLEGKSGGGYTILHILARGSMLDQIPENLRGLIIPNMLEDQNNDGDTPLHAAAQGRAVGDIPPYVLEKITPTSANKRNVRQQTFFQNAANVGHLGKIPVFVLKMATPTSVLDIENMEKGWEKRSRRHLLPSPWNQMMPEAIELIESMLKDIKLGKKKKKKITKRPHSRDR